MKQSKIAITGGIGSGKSAVSKFIAEAGYPVYSCDSIYAELLSQKKFLNLLEEEFGQILNADGTLNREKLSAIVFNDSKAMKRLNNLTHPAIMSSAFEKMKGYELSFLEVPLLFENGFEKLFDGVIVVLRNKIERISAVASRDKISREQVVLRLKSQFDYDNSDFAEYYVIHNDSNLDDLRQKTLEIVQQIALI